MLQSLRLAALTMVLAVPLGVLFAIGVDRWRGRIPTGASFTMLMSFVSPEIILAIAFFLTFTFLLRGLIRPGTTAQVLGLSTLQIPYPFIVVRARLLTIGKEFEEAAMDLGSAPVQAVRRVLLPLLLPAIFAASGLASTEPLSVKVYNAARGAPLPSVNAAVSMMLALSLTVSGLAYLLYRSVFRSRQAGTVEGVGGLTTPIRV
jgi:spermidine/putrescine transport system permease protein